jgi:hypothetical protein
VLVERLPIAVADEIDEFIADLEPVRASWPQWDPSLCSG